MNRSHTPLKNLTNIGRIIKKCTERSFKMNLKNKAGGKCSDFLFYGPIGFLF